MVIIALFGGLFLAGVILAIWKRLGESPDSRDKSLHIV